MLKMVDGTGIIGVDMICPLGVSTPQPPNYDMVELEGTGMLVLPNSLDAPLERLELGGKTEQAQTTGKNLVDYKKIVVGLLNFVDGTFSGIYHTYFTTDFIEIESGDYVISHNSNVGIQSYALYDINNKTYVSGKAGNNKVNVLNKCLIRISFNTKPETDVSSNPIDYAKKCNIQLEKGTTATPYEPYTGGKPSPSQEYQQEIKNVGKWNEETQKYEVDVKITGRNLFNGKLSKGKFITDDMNVVSDLATMNTFDKPVEIEPNTDYVISANGVIWEGNINVYDENGKKIVQHFTGKFKTPSNAKYIRASISNARAPIDSKIQMEYGTAMNEFEQYHQPQVLTLTSDRPITKWDRLVEQGGEIGWLYKSAFINGFNGDGYTIRIVGNIGSVGRYTIIFPGALIEGNASADIYVDKYRGVSAGYAKEEYGICCNWNDGVKYFNAPNENVKTLDDFKKWLTENPLTIAYETEGTTFIPLPQSEQNAIRALTTYYPTTVITVDGGEVDPDIKLTYRKEI